MPSLSDTLQQSQQKQLVRDAQGNLVQQNPTQQPSLQQLVGQAGLQAAPTTAIGQAAIGANADQQKMAGTPQQKQLALAQSTQAPAQNDLATTLREQQANPQASAQAQKEATKSQDMQNLGQLGDRVTDFVNAQMTALQAATPQAPAAAPTQVPVAGATNSALPATTGTPSTPAATPLGNSGITYQPGTGVVNGVDLSTIKDQLSAVANNPQDQTALANLNNALGLTANTVLDPSQIMSLYGDSISAIAQKGGDTVAKSLNMGDLITQGGLGYDANQLSQLLEVPPDQVSKMSIQDVQNQIAKMGSNEFSSTQKLNNQVNSNELGAAEKGLAQQAGQQASASGLRATEANYNDLQNQINNANTIQFNGQSMKVEDLLGNDTISKTITDYLNAAPGSATRAQLDKTEPQLSNFINQNQAVLSDAANQMQAGESTLQKTQAANKQLATIGGITLSDQIMQSLVPNWGQISASKIDTGKSGVLSVAQNLSPTDQTKFANEVNSNPDAASQLGALSAQEVQNLGITQPGSPWQSYKQASQQQQQFQALDPNNMDAIVSAATNGQVANAAQAQQYIQTNTINSLLGTGTPVNVSALQKLVGMSPADAKQSLVSSVDPGQLKSLAAGQKPTTYTPPQLTTPVSDQTPAAQDVIQKLGPAAASGKLSPQDIANAGLSLDDLNYLRTSMSKALADPKSGTVSDSNPNTPALQQVNSLFNTAVDNNTNSVINNITSVTPDSTSQIQALQQVLNQQQSSGNPEINASTLVQKIQQLQAQQQAGQDLGGGNGPQGFIPQLINNTVRNDSGAAQSGVSNVLTQPTQTLSGALRSGRL